MDVAVFVGNGVGVCEGIRDGVGSRVSVDETVGMDATAVSVDMTFAASAVKAMTVGKYSGG